MHSILYEYDEQRHIENEKRWSYEDGKEDGIQEGFQKGRLSEKEQGIQILIQNYLELNISDEIMIEKLKEYYHLEEEIAKEYIKKARQN